MIVRDFCKIVLVNITNMYSAHIKDIFIKNRFIKNIYI